MKRNRNWVDEIGKKYNFLTILKLMPSLADNRTRIWVKCDCGFEKEVDGYLVRSGRTRSCGCKTRDLRCKHILKKPGHSGLVQLYGRYRATSRRETKVPFKLTLEYFEKLTSSNCYYCNAQPSMVSKNNASQSSEIVERSKYIYNGVDRKINSLGYTKENSVPCCWRCNKMKSDLDFDQFIDIVRRIGNKFRK